MRRCETWRCNRTVTTTISHHSLQLWSYDTLLLCAAAIRRCAVIACGFLLLRWWWWQRRHQGLLCRRVGSHAIRRQIRKQNGQRYHLSHSGCNRLRHTFLSIATSNTATRLLPSLADRLPLPPPSLWRNHRRN
jgi:hypothetical protein